MLMLNEMKVRYNLILIGFPCQKCYLSTAIVVDLNQFQTLYIFQLLFTKVII